jgi:hypothetical protein
MIKPFLIGLFGSIIIFIISVYFGYLVFLDFGKVVGWVVACVIMFVLLFCFVRVVLKG